MMAIAAEDEQAEHQRRAATAGSPWPPSAPAACSARTRPTPAPCGPRWPSTRRRRPVAGTGAGRRHPASGLALRRSHGAAVYGSRRCSNARSSAIARPSSVASRSSCRCGCSCWTTTTASCSTSSSTSASSAPSRSSTATTPSPSPRRSALEPDGVLISPGPGRPEDAGIICDAVAAFAERGTPVLGVCLGHQAIGHVYGGDDRRRHRADARQDVADRPHGDGRLRRPAVTADGDALPLADHRPGDAARRASRSRPPPPTARSWACATATSTSRASSSTPRASSPPAATTSSRPGWPAATERFSSGSWSHGRPISGPKTGYAEALDDGGVGHAAALAHRLQAVAAAGALELVEQRGHQPGAGAAERVAEGDGAAVDVDLAPCRGGAPSPTPARPRRTPR